MSEPVARIPSRSNTALCMRAAEGKSSARLGYEGSSVSAMRCSAITRPSGVSHAARMRKEPLRSRSSAPQRVRRRAPEACNSCARRSQSSPWASQRIAGRFEGSGVAKTPKIVDCIGFIQSAARRHDTTRRAQEACTTPAPAPWPDGGRPAPEPESAAEGARRFRQRPWAGLC